MITGKHAILTYVIPTLLVLAIIDIVLFVSIENWSDGRVVDVAFIHLAFVLSIASDFIAPGGPNKSLFGLTTAIFTKGYLILEVVLALIFIIVDVQGVVPIIIQVILLMIFGIFFFTSMGVNRNIAQHDEAIRVTHRRLESIQDTMYMAFTSVDDIGMKKIVESAYDESCSISGYGCTGFEEIDSTLYEIAIEILASARNQDSNSLTVYCKKFKQLCSEREMLVKQNHRQ